MRIWNAKKACLQSLPWLVDIGGNGTHDSAADTCIASYWRSLQLHRVYARATVCVHFYYRIQWWVRFFFSHVVAAKWNYEIELCRLRPAADAHAIHLHMQIHSFIAHAMNLFWYCFCEKEKHVRRASTVCLISCLRIVQNLAIQTARQIPISKKLTEKTEINVSLKSEVNSKSNFDSVYSCLISYLAAMAQWPSQSRIEDTNALRGIAHGRFKMIKLECVTKSVKRNGIEPKTEGLTNER